MRTEGLGDSTHVLAHDGLALVVDPQRDIDRFLSALDEEQAELAVVLETHVHNDYVSGGRDLARTAGAELVMPAAAAPAFAHRPAFHYEDIDLGNLSIRPIHTPGHTPEHTSYLIIVDGEPRALFSGGSLLVGSAGRTDLLGEPRAESLARLQYGSVMRLAALDDAIALYPTHGAGSFCTTSVAGALTSTIGLERETSSVLAYADEDQFVKGQLSGLVPFPKYYASMGPINLTGLPEPDLEVGLVDEPVDGTTIIDARPAAAFAAGHIPGSIGIELRDSFGTWVGWLTEHNTPLTLILDEDQDQVEAVRQLIRIGYDDIRGVARIPDEGLVSYETVDVERFAGAVEDGAQVLDVRAPDEHERGLVDGSIASYLPDVAEETPQGLDPAEPVWIACGGGFRASVAASILQSRGFQPIVLAGAGVTEVLARTSK